MAVVGESENCPREQERSASVTDISKNISISMVRCFSFHFTCCRWRRKFKCRWRGE